MLAHCDLRWENQDYNLGTYGNTDIPLTSSVPPRRSFEVGPSAIRTYAPRMMQDFQLDHASALSLCQIPEPVGSDGDRIIDSDPETSFTHPYPRLSIVCNRRFTSIGQPAEHIIFAPKDVDERYCEVFRQRRMVMGAGKIAVQRPLFSVTGAKIISMAEMTALGELTDMLYLNSPDAIRYTPAKS